MKFKEIQEAIARKFKEMEGKSTEFGIQELESASVVLSLW